MRTKVMHCLELMLLAFCLLASLSYAQQSKECPRDANWEPTAEELSIILRDHDRWAKSRGLSAKEKRKVTCCQAILCKADLHGVDLHGANLAGADLRGAKLFLADLSTANLQSADLRGADLRSIDLHGANLRYVKLAGGYLSGANLQNADLSNADMTDTDLRGAQMQNAVLSRTALKNAKFTHAKLMNAIYEAASAPAEGYLSRVSGLRTVQFGPGEHGGLVQLRVALQNTGLRELEREATFAIESGKTKHALAGYVDTVGKPKKSIGAVLEGALRLIFFEWTTGYGLYYGRPLLLIFGFIAVMTLIYIPVIATKKQVGNRSGIFRIWPSGRIEETGENFDTADDEIVERLNARGLSALGYALYFSALSAFQIGWRDLNIGSWLTRLQSQEYVLRGRGWVRVLSGVQSLVSVYLLAMWALTYFGRPFQ